MKLKYNKLRREKIKIMTDENNASNETVNEANEVKKILTERKRKTNTNKKRSWRMIMSSSCLQETERMVGNGDDHHQ